MSRCQLQGKNPDQTIFVGIDSVFQAWFIQIHSKEEEAKENGNGGYIHNIDHASKNTMLTMLKRHASLDTIYAEEVFNHIALDLDPANIP